MNELMKQAQAMGEKMQAMQKDLEKLEVIGKSGGGLVQVTLNGKGSAKKVKLDPSLLIKEDIEILEDLLVAAINDARTKSEQIAQENSTNMLGNIPLPPGFKFPF